MTDQFSELDRVLLSRLQPAKDQGIVVLGPGASADSIEKDALKRFFVISINDAELIFPADICVYHGDWVSDRISEAGPSSTLYVTGQYSKRVTGATCMQIDTQVGGEDSAMLSIQRLVTGDLFIDDTMFLTALQIAARARHLLDRPIDVYMLGFDFDPDAGYSRSIRGDEFRSSHPDLLVKMLGHAEYFKRASRILETVGVTVRHVGARDFSDLSATEFNRLFGAHPKQSASHDAQHSVSVVAELTTNHFGDRHRLASMIRACAEAGADYIKLQKRDVDSFYTAEQLDSPYISPYGETFGDYRRKIELDDENFMFVDRLTNSLGLQWFASVLDYPSFEIMRAYEMPMIKLPSTISNHRDFLQSIARTYCGPVVVSTGMTDSSYEEFLIDVFRNSDRLYLLQCNSGYPTPLRDCNLGVIAHYVELGRGKSNIVPGYSSHDPGWFASTLAVAAGAKMVEKHVKLGTTDWAHFDVVAVDLASDDFAQYVTHIREAELAMGDGIKRPQPSEHHKY